MAQLPVNRALFLQEMAARFSCAHLPSEQISERAPLSLSWKELDALLPDGGFSHGVVELAAPRVLGGGTMVALAAIRAAQRNDPKAWCAWIDPISTLYAPGVVMAGVEVHRLFVARPPRKEVARLAIKMARSQAFTVMVIDFDLLDERNERHDKARSLPHQHGRSAEVLVRKLALLASEGHRTILLLTDARIARSSRSLPVALRLELTRAPTAIEVRITKDRYGRGGLAKTVPLQTRPVLHLAG